MEAKKLRETLSAQLAARTALTMAIESRDITSLQNSIAKAKAVGVASNAEEVSFTFSCSIPARI